MSDEGKSNMRARWLNNFATEKEGTIWMKIDKCIHIRRLSQLVGLSFDFKAGGLESPMLGNQYIVKSGKNIKKEEEKESIERFCTQRRSLVPR